MLSFEVLWTVLMIAVIINYIIIKDERKDYEPKYKSRTGIGRS